MTDTAFADLRARVADALDDPTSPLLTDVAVLPDVVDSLTPPAWLLTWGDPWMVPATFCTHTVRLDVVCIAGRIDPAPGIATIEEMVAVALSRLRAAGLPEATVLPPARYDVGGVPYLAARISIDARIAVPLPQSAPVVDGAAQLVANAVLSATGASATFGVKTGAATLTVTATLTATGATGAYPTSTATATLSTTGTLAATGATAAWPRQSGAALLSTTGTLAATGATSSGVWSPADLAPSGWWDFSDIATLTIAGANVSQAANKSGTAGPLLQPTGALQPLTGNNVNGRNALTFGGTAELHTATLSLSQPYTVFSVIGYGTAPGGVTRWLDAGGAGNRPLVVTISGAWNIGAGANVSTGRAPSTGTKQTVVVFNGAASAFYENAVQYGGTLNPSTGAMPKMSVGDGDGGGNAAGGAYCEFVVLPRVATAGERASWNSYTLAKWGV